jgi:hypothetical protein
MNNKSGVYKITNLSNNKFYIGQAFNLHRREIEHFRKLKQCCHFNTHLQNSYNKHGKECLLFEVILFCEKNELTYYEQKLVTLLDPEYNVLKKCVNVYPLTSNKISNSMIGHATSKETRLKISLNSAQRGKPMSEKMKQILIAANTGHHHSEETRRKIGDSHRGEKSVNFGKHPSEETRKKLSEISHNRAWTKERCLNISRAKMGHFVSEETKQKMSASRKGIPAWNKGKSGCYSDETKQKISESLKRYYQT